MRMRPFIDMNEGTRAIVPLNAFAVLINRGIALCRESNGFRVLHLGQSDAQVHAKRHADQAAQKVGKDFHNSTLTTSPGGVQVAN